MWRPGSPDDDEAVIELCRLLNREDPGPSAVPRAHIERTLAVLRRDPHRGVLVVLDEGGKVEGYALLIFFWSNELGGETHVIDELFVNPNHRGQGHATRLIEALVSGAVTRSPAPRALALEVSPRNETAQRLYARLGFEGNNRAMRRVLNGRDS